ncbi:hypothetical protein, partial [Yoonia sp.]|uniref:hypothetical protein n=1 Tax=Yoonia sp. TaxID=2212373 RepID=UPI0039190BDF
AYSLNPILKGGLNARLSIPTDSGLNYGTWSKSSQTVPFLQSLQTAHRPDPRSHIKCHHPCFYANHSHDIGFYQIIPHFGRTAITTVSLHPL